MRKTQRPTVVDINPAGDKIGFVPEEQKATRGASRYDAVIATLVGVCALCVSGYTAYMQRQQVRAAVWPILEFDSSNRRTFISPSPTKAWALQSSAMSS